MVTSWHSSQLTQSDIRCLPGDRLELRRITMLHCTLFTFQPSYANAPVDCLGTDKCHRSATD